MTDAPSDDQVEGRGGRSNNENSQPTPLPLDSMTGTPSDDQGSTEFYFV